jgi:hypothetical protein
MNCLHYNMLSHSVKVFHHVNADQLKGLPVVIGILDKVRSKVRWFLNTMLSHEPMLMWPYNCGKNPAEMS